MWTYILRRLLLMVPTLFGVTVVSFCIMQLAPGDPLLMQLGAGGAAGQSSQTREAYLIQKRDLKLDKPLVLNFNGLRNFDEQVGIAAHYLGSTLGTIEGEVPSLASALADTPDGRRSRFLRRLKIPDFDRALRNPEQRTSIARKIQAWVQTYCEDIGKHGVPAAIGLLDAPDLRARIGAIRCLNRMVVDPFVFTFSSRPAESETPGVVAAWRTWWEQSKDGFPPVDPDRRAALESQLAALSALTDRTMLFERLQDNSFDRDDVPFFIDTLLGDPSFRSQVVASIVLKLFIAEPLQLDVPLDAQSAVVNRVAANWKVHYETNLAAYRPSLARRLWDVIADTQYAHMVWRLATFNFGRSALKTREPVSEKIWSAVVVSAPLMLMSQLLVYVVAVPLGVACAVSRGGTTDRLISLFLFVLYSIPAFVAGMLFLMALCYGRPFKWFPTLGLHSDGSESLSAAAWLQDYFWHATLPVVCLSLFSLAGLAMYARSSMLEVIGHDYIRTARAKGVGEAGVILKHALRNSLIPIITLFSSFLPAMLGGSVLIEVLFGIPGMGRLSWVSIEQKDFPTLMALIYIDAIVVMLSILLSDILYVLVDPRISFESKGAG
ncbi:MAG: ABC transporter permease subunit [Planctomycetaceae bacterium]